METLTFRQIFSYLYILLTSQMNSILKRASSAILMMLCAMIIHGPFSLSRANPIIEPPVLTEIYFGPDGWQIEMLFDEMFQGVIYDLDNFRLSGLNGWAPFNAGINVVPGEVMMVTNDNLQYPLLIEPQGDEIWLEEFFGSEWYRISPFPLRFGTLPAGNSTVTAPSGEESIAMCHILVNDPQSGWFDYWTLKEKPNTIGNEPLVVSKRAYFQGCVLDENLQPMPGIRLSYCPLYYNIYTTTPPLPWLETDQEGYFFTDSMFCRCYDIEFIHDGTMVADTGLICVEPDSANYHTFVLDTLLTSTTEQKERELVIVECFPNPTRGPLHFRFLTTPGRLSDHAVIRLYGISSRGLDEIHVRLDEEEVDILYDLGSMHDPAGSIYLYTVEINDRTIASGKLMMTK